MSKKGRRSERKAARLEQRSTPWFAIATVGIVALVATAIVTTRLGGSGGSEGKAPAAGKASGSVSALGVEASAQLIELGKVPLNTTVEPTWKLTNSSDKKVAFGEPHADVVEGCCPGPLQLGEKELAAGASTELVFPLQMHPGMDGPHEFAVHVPVKSDGEEEILTLSVTGNFAD